MARWKWALILVILLPVSALLGLLIWWRLCQREQAVASLEPLEIAPVRILKETVRPAGPALSVADDLKRIEGIGPKIAGVLLESGITTFAELAAADEGQLRQLLKEAGIRVAFPGSWLEQASLAAAGDWVALEALQGQRKGGRPT